MSKLKDYIIGIVDNRGKNPEKYYENEKYPVIDNYLIKNNRYPNKKEVKRHIDEETYLNFLRGYLEKDDVLITLVGNGIGNVCLIPSQEFVTIQNSIGLKTKKELLDSRYLYYYFLRHQKSIIKLNRGSSQPNIHKDDLLNMRVKFPKITIQTQIADKLSIYDDLIEMNELFILTLEEYAQLIFHKWFADFNFPDKEGKPYKDNGGKMYEVDGKMIPTGWELIPINNIIKKMTETINPQNEPDKVFKHYSIPVFDVTRTYANELGSTILSNKYKVEDGCLLVSKLNPWFKRIIYPLNIDEAICSTEFVVWKPVKENHLEYLYVLANTAKFTRYCTNASMGTSNSHKRIDPDFMLKFNIPYNEQVVIQFNEMVKPIIQKIQLMVAENQLLEETRDLLIKKLIK